MKTQILSFQQKYGLGIAQLNVQPKDSLRYLSLSNAMKRNMIEVSEISESGSVNDILVINESDKYIFASDGDILSGAKQNRILNTSVFLPPLSRTQIPVSCVEGGRWRYRSSKFDPTDYVAPSEMRREKAQQVNFNLRSEQKAYADQSAIWSKVSFYESKTGHKSGTSDFSESFERGRFARDRFYYAFRPDREANGVVFFIDGRIRSIDIFNRRAVFAEYFPKLLRGMTLDLSERHMRHENVMTENPADVLLAEARRVLNELEGLEGSTHAGVGCGEEKRFESPVLNGFVLSFEGEMVHSAINLY